MITEILINNTLTQIRDALQIIADSNKGINWNMVTAIGTCVTPIVCALLSFFLGQKLEHQKAEIANANATILNLVKGKNDVSCDSIYDYIKACITVSTKQVADYYSIDQSVALSILKSLEAEKKIIVYKTGKDNSKWLWQIKK